MKAGSLIFLGFILGSLATVLLFSAGFFCLASFLVADSEPERADAIIVLGGDDGSRFSEALVLQKNGFGRDLVLVDGKQEYWNHIAPNLCNSSKFKANRLTCLTGSVNTITDAELSLEYGLKRQWKKVIVVTSPYHSRRATVIFSEIFHRFGIEVVVVHSAGFGNDLPPTRAWWKNSHTLNTVWLEFGKLIHFKLRGWFA